MTNTINVPRELLERTIDRLKYGHEHDKALRELRAILATAKSAAADDERMRFDLWAEQQGWPKDHTMLHELWLAWKAGALKYAPSPAGVDGLEVRAYEDSGGALYTAKLLEIMEVDSVGCEPLCRLSDAQAIIDGLRGENERIRLNIAEYNEAISCYQSERDQHAQRIGELAELAAQASVNCKNTAYYLRKYRPDLADICSGWCVAIDAALSAGKEGE